MYLSAFSRPQPSCFAVGFPYRTGIAASLIGRFRKFEVPRAAVLTGTMASEPLNGRRKLQKFRFQTIQHVVFFGLYCTLILVVTTVGKGDSPTYRTIQANKARNVANSILGPWCGIGCFVGGSTAKCWRRHFWWWHVKHHFTQCEPWKFVFIFFQQMTFQRFLTEKNTFYSALIITIMFVLG